jgi:tRNA threonylcarbamoyladenosine biosynthesis protein TsaB
MAYFLLIETATEVCSVALVQDGRLIDMEESVDGQNHSRLVSVFAEKLLARNRVNPSELRAVGVSKGPGSYTGLRIGVSTAKGICFALGIPLVAVGTLEAMSRYVAKNHLNFGISDDLPALYCPMIDARRMEVFSMLLDQEGTVLKPVSAEIIDQTFLAGELSAHRVVFFGNGAAKCKEVLNSPRAVFLSGIRASSEYMNELVWDAYNKKRFEDVAYFEPFYLKDFVATVSKKSMLQ